MMCPKCRNTEHLEGARYCMVCGSPLEGCKGCENEDKGLDSDFCWNCSRRGHKDLFRRKWPVKEETT